MIVGDHKHHEQVTEEACKIVMDMQTPLEKQCHKKFAKFVVLQHTTQVVNGINHKFKVQIGENECIHVKIHESHKGEYVITEFHPSMSMEDVL